METPNRLSIAVSIYAWFAASGNQTPSAKEVFDIAEELLDEEMLRSEDEHNAWF